MRAGYRAFLMGTATDLPTRGYLLAPQRAGNDLLRDIRKWDKVITHREQ